VPILESLKEYAERTTGLRKPGKSRAPDLIRTRKPHAVRFKDDGLIPNHPRWPFIHLSERRASLAWLVVSVTAWCVRRKMRSVRRRQTSEKISGPAVSRELERARLSSVLLPRRTHLDRGVLIRMKAANRIES